MFLIKEGGGGYALENFVFSNFGFLHIPIDICLKSICTKFQVDLSKIGGEMAIFTKVSMIRKEFAERTTKIKKRLKEVRFSEGSDKKML